MKRILLLSLLGAMFTPDRSFAQGYIPFPENYAVWTLQYEYGPDSQQDRYHIYTADGDTVINGISYNKLYHEETTQTVIFAWDSVLNLSLFLPTPGTTTSPKTYQFAYRNDTANKLVYRVLHDSITEFIWYNFNFNIGDSLPLYMVYPDGGPPSTSIVSDIDTIIYCGVPRRRYLVDPTPCYWGSTFHIIEGVGNDQTFTSPACSMAEYFGTWLFCFVNYDQCAPSDPYTPCNLTVGIDEYIDNHIGVYPNPASSSIMLGEMFEKGCVLNYMGQICIQFQEASWVNIEKLHNGMYIIQAQKNGNMYYARFLKE